MKSLPNTLNRWFLVASFQGVGAAAAGTLAACNAALTNCAGTFFRGICAADYGNNFVTLIADLPTQAVGSLGTDPTGFLQCMRGTTFGGSLVPLGRPYLAISINNLGYSDGCANFPGDLQLGVQCKVHDVCAGTIPQHNSGNSVQQLR